MRWTFETFAAFSFCPQLQYSQPFATSLLKHWRSSPAMAKRTRVKPSSSRRTRSYHQANDLFMEDDDFEELSKGFIPPNAAADLRKFVHLFQVWAKDSNACFPGEKVPDDLLLTDDHQSLSCWLLQFCTEMRKVDGTRYPPRTIQHYLLGIQRHIRKCK